MPRNKHGGRRPGSGRPRLGTPKTTQVKFTLTPGEASRLDLLCQPDESRAAYVRRLVLAMLPETYSVIDLDTGEYLAGPGLTEQQAASLEQQFRAQGYDAAAVTDSSIGSPK